MYKRKNFHRQVAAADRPKAGTADITNQAFAFSPRVQTDIKHTVCVYSFEDAGAVFNKTQVPVSSFILEDGSMVSVTFPLVRAVFSIYPGNELGSVFHSTL
jgi:hypothetical protein